MKRKMKMPKLGFRGVTSSLFLLIVLAEILITFNYLYKNMHEDNLPVNDSGIIKADLKGYSQVYTDLNSRGVYAPQDFIYINPNPFKFGP